MLLRIYADFNSTTEDGWCWCLRYQGVPVEDCVEQLSLVDGMSVVLFYSDVEEEFEFDGILSYRACGPNLPLRWEARADERSIRRIRPESNDRRHPRT